MNVLNSLFSKRIKNDLNSKESNKNIPNDLHDVGVDVSLIDIEEYLSIDAKEEEIDLHGQHVHVERDDINEV